MIVLIQFRNRPDVILFPDERATIAAERADTDDNAYYMLVEAVELLPHRPSVVHVPEAGTTQPAKRFKPRSNSVSHIAGISLPEDDPRFLGFLRDAEPAIQKAKTALNRPYFRFQFPLTIRNGDIRLPANVQFSPLFTVWIAHANAQIRFWNEEEEGLDSITDLARVLKMMTGEPLKEYYGWETREFTIDFYKIIQTLIGNTTDYDTLVAIEASMRAHPTPNDDMESVLLGNLRMLDNTYKIPELMNAMGKQAQVDIEDQFFLIQLQSVAGFYVDHVDELREVVNQPIPGYRDWLNTAEWWDVPWADYMDSHVTLGLFNALYRAHQQNGYREATRLCAILRRYQLDHESFPETLDALVPDYIDDIPKSPATDAPFEYRSSGNFYTLQDIPVHYFGYRGESRHEDPYVYVKADEFRTAIN